jgi:hypothetical protein
MYFLLALWVEVRAFVNPDHFLCTVWRCINDRHRQGRNLADTKPPDAESAVGICCVVLKVWAIALKFKKVAARS